MLRPHDLRSLLVDDSSRFLTAARELLEREGIEVVGVAFHDRGGHAARRARLRPDVCLVDIDLGDESGFDLARRLAESGNDSPRVILISAYPERDFADMIADSPAVGFLRSQRSRGACPRERIRADASRASAPPGTRSLRGPAGGRRRSRAAAASARML